MKVLFLAPKSYSPLHTGRVSFTLGNSPRMSENRANGILAPSPSVLAGEYLGEPYYLGDRGRRPMDHRGGLHKGLEE